MADQIGVPQPVSAEAPEGGTTGRFLVLLAEDAVDAGIKALAKGTGIKPTKIAGAELAAADQPFEDADGAAVIAELGVAVLDAPPDQGAAIGVAAAESSAILAVEP